MYANHLRALEAIAILREETALMVVESPAHSWTVGDALAHALNGAECLVLTHLEGEPRRRFIKARKLLLGPGWSESYQ